MSWGTAYHKGTAENYIRTTSSRDRMRLRGEGETSDSSEAACELEAQGWHSRQRRRQARKSSNSHGECSDRRDGLHDVHQTGRQRLGTPEGKLVAELSHNGGAVPPRNGQSKNGLQRAIKERTATGNQRTDCTDSERGFRSVDSWGQERNKSATRRPARPAWCGTPRNPHRKLRSALAALQSATNR